MGCSRYVGRVGALAVALGIGTAMTATHTVAWADTEPGESASTDSAAADGTMTTSADTSDSDLAGGANLDDSDAAEELTETADGGVDDVGDEGDSGAAETDSAEPEEITEDEIAGDVVVELDPYGIEKGSADDRSASLGGAVPPRTVREVAVPDGDLVIAVETDFVETAGEERPAAQPAPGVPAAEVVADEAAAPQAESATLTSVLSSIVTPFGASDTDAPVESPLGWALLAFARRQLGQRQGLSTEASNLTAATDSATGDPNAVPTGWAWVGSPGWFTANVSGQVFGRDQDRDRLTYTGPTAPTAKGGTVQVNSRGGFTYTPSAEARHTAARADATEADATDSFVVTVDDGNGGTADVEITVRIRPANDRPEASGVVGPPDMDTGVVSGAVATLDSDDDVLTYAVSEPRNGEVVIHPDGTFTYTPTEEARQAAGNRQVWWSSAARRDSFTITVDDGHGGSDRVRFTVQIAATDNDAPALEDIDRGSPSSWTGRVSGRVLATDADGDRLTYSGSVITAKGRATLSSSGRFTYTPTADARHAAAADGATAAERTDSFAVTVSDGFGRSLVVPVTVDIAPHNVAPQVIRTRATTPDAEAGVVTVTVSARDSDGDALTYSGPAATLKGRVVNNGDGTFAYSPTEAARQAAGATNASATDKIDELDLTVSDGHGGITTTTVRVPIAPSTSTNGAPENPDVTVNAPGSNGTITGTVTAADPEDDPLIFSGSTATAKGSVVVRSDGSFTYTPTDAARHAAAADDSPASARSDSFIVTVSDNHGATLNIAVSVAIVPANSAPAADFRAGTPNAATGVVEGAVTSTDADGDTRIYRTSGTSTHGGAVTLDSSTGEFLYMPTEAARALAAQTPGTDTDTFTVTVDDLHGGTDTVLVHVTVAPAVSHSPNPAAVGSVAVGRTPIDVVVSPGGRYVYTADQGSSFSAHDGTVTIVDTTTNTVTATVHIGGSVQSLAVGAGGASVYVVSVNESDDGGTVSILDTATNTITATIGLAAGNYPSSVAVTPDGETLVVASHDGTITVIDTFTKAVVRTLGVGGYANRVAVSPDSQQVWVAHDDNYPQVSVITLSNGQVEDIATGDYPSTQDVIVSPDGSRAYVLGDGITIVDTSTKAVIATVAGVFGRDLAVSPDSRYLYLASGDGTITVIDTVTRAVTKTIDIGAGLSAVALSADGGRLYVTNNIEEIVTAVEVYSGNAGPVVGSVDVGDPDPTTGVVTGSVHATDVNGDSVSFAGSATTGKGTVVVNADGTFTFVPTDDARHAAAADNAPPADRTDTIYVSVSDGRGEVTTVPITVAIGPANSAPTLLNSYTNAPDSDGVVTGRVIARDADDDTQIYGGSTTTAKGTFVVGADGRFTYTPTSVARHSAAATGADAAAKTDMATVTVRDGHGGLLEVPLLLTVSPKNTEAVLTGWVGQTDSVTGVVTGRFLAYDADGDTIIFRTNTTNTNFSLNLNGTFTYTPTADARYRAAAGDADPADLVATFHGTLDDGHIWVSGPIPSWDYSVPISPGNIDEQVNLTYTLEGFGTVHALRTGPDGRIYVGHVRESGYVVGFGTIGRPFDWSHYRAETVISIIDPESNFATTDYSIPGISAIDDIAVAADGTIYAIDSGTMIELDTATGMVETVYHTDPPVSYSRQGYSRVLVGPDNRVYAWSDDSGLVVRLNRADNSVVTHDTGAQEVDGVAFDSAGTMYIATNRGFRVVGIDGTVQSPPYDNSTFGANGEIVTAPNGDVFYADIESYLSSDDESRIHAVNPDGSIGVRVAKVSGRVEHLEYFVSGPDGAIYTLSDGGLVVIDPTRNAMSVTPIDAVNPSAMTVGGDGRLYVDRYYNRDTRAEDVDGLPVRVINRGASITVYSRVPTGTPPAGTVITQAPGSLQGMWDIVRNDVTGTDNEGIYVQTIRGTDGKNRLVVYLGGTTDDATNQSIFENVPSAVGVIKDDQIDTINRAIAKCSNDTDCGSIEEIMLVGYSQGGLDAQNIAVANLDQPITALITFGAPIVSNAVGPATVHIQDEKDRIPNIVWDYLHNPVHLGAIALANSLGTVYSEESGIDDPSDFPWQGTHVNVNTYGILAADFEAGSGHQSVRNALTRFRGVVIDETEGVSPSDG